MKLYSVAAGLAAAMMCTGAYAVDLEVAHWWTSGGEAKAVKVLADAWNATGNTWVDGAIAGSGLVARPIMISRIQGGKPMDATIMNLGRDTEELIRAGMMTDLSDLASSDGWDKVINPNALAACTLDGKVWCAPVMVQSTLWLWLNRQVFETNGLPVPKDWNELVAAAPSLREKGIIPLALAGGWPIGIAMDNIAVAAAGKPAYMAVYKDRSAEAASGPDWKRVFEAYDNLRKLVNPSEMAPTHEWAQSVAQVISGKAAGVIMGSWAQPEFTLAGQAPGVEYDCLPGLGLSNVADFSGDAMFFPKVDDPARQKGQLELAHLVVSPEVQVPFNLAKGSMPVRGDVNLDAADDCMKKGLAITADPNNIVPNLTIFISPDTRTQITDLQNEFLTNLDITAEDAQARFVDIIASAE